MAGKGWIGLNIVVFYDDKEKVNRRSGLCSNFDEMGVELDNKIFIPAERIVRVEVQ